MRLTPFFSFSLRGLSLEDTYVTSTSLELDLYLFQMTERCVYPAQFVQRVSCRWAAPIMLEGRHQVL